MGPQGTPKRANRSVDAVFDEPGTVRYCRRWLCPMIASMQLSCVTRSGHPSTPIVGVRCFVERPRPAIYSRPALAFSARADFYLPWFTTTSRERRGRAEDEPKGRQTRMESKRAKTARGRRILSKRESKILENPRSTLVQQPRSREPAPNRFAFTRRLGSPRAKSQPSMPRRTPAHRWPSMPRRGSPSRAPRRGPTKTASPRPQVARGQKSSALVNELLTDLFRLKQPHSVHLRRHNAVHPWEDASPLEFLCQKNDASLFAFGTHSKKRPHNLVLGRMFDHKMLDMWEFGVDASTPMAAFAKGGIGPSAESKPLLLFQARPTQLEPYPYVSHTCTLATHQPQHEPCPYSALLLL